MIESDFVKTYNSYYFSMNLKDPLMFLNMRRVSALELEGTTKRKQGRQFCSDTTSE